MMEINFISVCRCFTALILLTSCTSFVMKELPMNMVALQKIQNGAFWMPKVQTFACRKTVADRILIGSLAASQPEEDTIVNQTIIRTSITDWVRENLESQDSKITWTSSTRAGENDIIPNTGLCIGNVRILAAGASNDAGDTEDQVSNFLIPIKLLVGRNGWGTGVHPTTRLCLEFICDSNVISGGETVLDYGCGSGILSIAALHMGAARCIGVDIEAEALVTAERNVQLNGYGEERFEPLHTREVLPYGITMGAGVDICVANILIGQLVRPSMVAAVVTNVAPGGLLCFSGIRPGEVDSLKAAYDEYVEEWLDDHYAELKSSECEGSIESYGYDCGEWCRLVGRRKTTSARDDILSMSDLAVS